MEIHKLDWWYHRQFESYYVQIEALFSGYQIRTGMGRDGQYQYRTVPCKMALYDKQVSSILRNNSDNTLNAVPQISIWPVSVSYNPKRMQDPLYTDKVSVYERFIDPKTGKYTNEIGNSYMVERYMPAIFELVFQVDIWTSNIDQKYQLLEQILSTTVPCINLQTSENPLDWSSLSFVEFKDLTLTSRSIPIGTNSDIDIASIQYQTVVNLNLPAKVTRLKIIEQIVTNINKLTEDPMIEPLLSREIITPGDHAILVEGNIITLLNAHSAAIDKNADLTWKGLFELYRKEKGREYHAGYSTIRLRTSTDVEARSSDVWGTFELTDDPQKLLITFDIGSLPANTLKPVNAVINPIRSYPGNNLPIATNGDRYLINEDIPSGGLIWAGLHAKTGDIIEFHNGMIRTEYLINNYTGKQLKWIPDVYGWRMSIDDEYRAGYWSLVL